MSIYLHYIYIWGIYNFKKKSSKMYMENYKLGWENIIVDRIMGQSIWYSDSDPEIIYSATHQTITIFTYIWFQYNGPRRPPLRQNFVAGMGATQMRYLYVHVYIIFYIYMYIYIIIHNIWLARNKYITWIHTKLD